MVTQVDRSRVSRVREHRVRKADRFLFHSETIRCLPGRAALDNRSPVTLVMVGGEAETIFRANHYFSTISRWTGLHKFYRRWCGALRRRRSENLPEASLTGITSLRWKNRDSQWPPCELDSYVPRERSIFPSHWMFRKNSFDLQSTVNLFVILSSRMKDRAAKFLKVIGTININVSHLFAVWILIFLTSPSESRPSVWQQICKIRLPFEEMSNTFQLVQLMRIFLGKWF